MEQSKRAIENRLNMIHYQLLTSKTYPILYEAQTKEHKILNYAKQSIDMRGNEYRIAEWAFQKMDFANFPSGTAPSFQLEKMRSSISNNDRAKQIDWIHHNCEDDIKSKWKKPPLTDEETADLLFEDLLQDNLEKLAQSVEATIKL